MITHKQNLLKPQTYQRAYEFLVALDIETSSLGELLDIGIQTVDGFQTFSNWHNFIEYLRSSSQRYIRVIAHNGNNFDYVGLMIWIAKNATLYNIDLNVDLNVLTADTMIIGFILKLPNTSISFVDTTRFFPGLSLEKIAQDLLGVGKKKISEKYINRMEVFKAKYEKRYYQYLQRDCELLYRIYENIREEINNLYPIGELGWSSGSTSMACFRKSLCKTRGAIIYGVLPQHYSFAQASYRGGMTLFIGDGKTTNANYYPQTNSYDIVSMYPSMMRCIPCPVSPIIEIDKLPRKQLPFGIFLVDFEQVKGRVPILFTRDTDENFPVWKGRQTWLTTFDLYFLRAFGKFKFYKGLIFQYQQYLFDSFIDSLWSKRNEAKQSNNTALSSASKILMNSLYGKFGQKPDGEKIGFSCDYDWYISQVSKGGRVSLATDIEFYKKYGFYMYAQAETRNSFSNQIVAALITSAARVKLGLFLNSVPTIYCDTDSIFTQKKIDNRFVGSNMGQFELKDNGKPMICLGKKLYLYGDECKAKGIPNKQLSSRIYEHLAKGHSQRIDYQSPSPLKTAIKKGLTNPNKFEDRFRTIKKDTSLVERGLIRLDAEFFSPDTVEEFLHSIWMM